MAKELERAGLPTALITSLPAVALAAGANRIVYGSGVMHPTGDPTRPSEDERAWREQVVATAIKALETPIETAQVFDPRAG